MRFYTADDDLRLEVRRGGAVRTVRLTHGPENPLGLELHGDGLEQITECANHCPFCFVTQLPPGMRRTLHIMAGRMVSLASLIGAAVGVVLLAIFVVWGHYPAPYLVYGLLAALIWLRHIDNIQRLLAGTERKIGQKAQPIR